jgi:hypothetical protein
VYSVCYINGFQSQPQDADAWLTDHADLLLRGVDGEPVIDPGWPDEMILDTSTSDTRAGIAAVMNNTIATCAASGFDAVEFDNLDSYSRSDGALTQDNNVDLATTLVAAVHAAGMAAGQKNSAELGARGHDEAGFDFAVTEQCARYDECSVYSDVYGDSIIDIEYADDTTRPFAEVCADPATPRFTILRDLPLGTPTDPGYVYEAC